MLELEAGESSLYRVEGVAAAHGRGDDHGVLTGVLRRGRGGRTVRCLLAVFTGFMAQPLVVGSGREHVVSVSAAADGDGVSGGYGPRSGQRRCQRGLAWRAASIGSKGGSGRGLHHRRPRGSAARARRRPRT